MVGLYKPPMVKGYLLTETPQLPSDIPQIPTMKGHSGSIKGSWGPPGQLLGQGLRVWGLGFCVDMNPRPGTPNSKPPTSTGRYGWWCKSRIALRTLNYGNNGSIFLTSFMGNAGFISSTAGDRMQEHWANFSTKKAVEVRIWCEASGV